ncbi:RDD family protein [Neobacillus sp. YIM B02564]|uniref:RDD family protein n=1 Tax=Neobacillus paridis TaxID=2803862 RepID=A0ABS1TLM5_9BACI|nr:RDD family protein [Neobacillus paridis]MBL4952207.1 RDD family protein [Neobacillus paridis]
MSRYKFKSRFLLLYVFLKKEATILQTSNENIASFWWRVLANFIDGVILSFVGSVISIFGQIIFIVGFGVDTSDTPDESGLYFGLGAFLGALIFFIIYLALYWLYYALFESKLGGTPGKLVCQLQVLTENGDKLSFKRATGHYFSRWIPFYWITAMFTEKKQGIHDILAHVIVIKKSSSPVQVPKQSL